MDTHPENTIAAFQEAIRLGAHMIEFDVQITKDSKLVIMHDETVDRTTNGTGLVSELTLEEIKKLDAGSWKSQQFAGEQVPTLKETLEIMPRNIWLNIHLKGGEKLGEATAKVLNSAGCINQGVIACNLDAARGAKKVNRNILICNMERQGNRVEYVNETIQGKYSFIQLLKKRNDTNLLNDIKRLKSNQIKINYYFGDTATEVKELFEQGVDFVLTNKLAEMLEVAESAGVARVEHTQTK
ncbi:MAG: glycerophosphodiester phosphodiesterase [Draconibacterium sp.]|nr:glycerophosphodiester phosphodiesterase [Draconibacterium sp.]